MYFSNFNKNIKNKDKKLLQLTIEKILKLLID